MAQRANKRPTIEPSQPEAPPAEIPPTPKDLTVADPDLKKYLEKEAKMKQVRDYIAREGLKLANMSDEEFATQYPTMQEWARYRLWGWHGYNKLSVEIGDKYPEAYESEDMRKTQSELNELYMRIGSLVGRAQIKKKYKR